MGELGEIRRPQVTCECCGREVSVSRNWRSDGGVISSYLLCDSCLFLNEDSFWNLYNNHTGFPEWLDKQTKPANIEDYFKERDKCSAHAVDEPKTN